MQNREYDRTVMEIDGTENASVLDLQEPSPIAKTNAVNIWVAVAQVGHSTIYTQAFESAEEALAWLEDLDADRTAYQHFYLRD